MIIKQSEQLKFIAFDFSPLNFEWIGSIYFINIFFREAFAYLKRGGALSFIKKIEKLLKNGMSFENVSISVDAMNNLVYISEIYYDADSILKCNTL